MFARLPTALVRLPTALARCASGPLARLSQRRLPDIARAMRASGPVMMTSAALGALLAVLIVIGAVARLVEVTFVRLGRARASGLDAALHDDRADAADSTDRPSRNGATAARTRRRRMLARTAQRPRGSLEYLVADRAGVVGPASLLRMAAQFAAAAVIAVWSASLWDPVGTALSVCLGGAFVWGVTDALPRHWGIEANDRMACSCLRLASWLTRCWPVVLVSRVLAFPSRLLGPRGPTAETSEAVEDELIKMAEAAAEADLIEQTEAQLISQIIELGDTIAREVMVPRPDIMTIAADATLLHALEAVVASGFTRLPVVGDGIDDVVGVALAKDLLAAYLADPDASLDAEHIRAAVFVPETKRVGDLMREMQATKNHVALTVDEYGGVAGLIALEDIIEELVGEIVDEFDDDQEDLLSSNGEGFVISGRMPASRLAEALDVHLPEGDWDTVGGLLLDVLGHVPDPGESADLGEWRFVAREVKGRRIVQVEAVRLG